MQHDGIVSRLTLSALALGLMAGPSLSHADHASPDLASTVAFQFRSVSLPGTTEKMKIYGESKQYFTEPHTGGSNYPNPFDVFAPSSIGNALLNGVFNGDKEFQVEVIRRADIAPSRVSETQFKCAEFQKQNLVDSLAALEASESGKRLALDLATEAQRRGRRVEGPTDYGVTIVVEDRSAIADWSPSRDYVSYEKQLVREQNASLKSRKSASSYYQSNGRNTFHFASLATAPSVRLGYYRGKYMVIQAVVNPQAKTPEAQCQVVTKEALAELWQIVAGFNPTYSYDTYFGGSLK